MEIRIFLLNLMMMMMMMMIDTGDDDDDDDDQVDSSVRLVSKLLFFQCHTCLFSSRSYRHLDTTTFLPSAVISMQFMLALFFR